MKRTKDTPIVTEPGVKVRGIWEARMKAMPSTLLYALGFIVLAGLMVLALPGGMTLITAARESLTPVSLETLVWILIVEVALVGLGLAALVVHRTSRAPRSAPRRLVEIKQPRGH